MECPKCKSHSVIIQQGTYVCGVPGCTYAAFHPISFENDIRQFDGEKTAANRYSSLYSNPLDGGGVSVNREANFQKQFRSGVRLVQNHCHLYKISTKIQSVAEARFASILRIKLGEKQLAEKKELNTNGKEGQGAGGNKSAEKPGNNDILNTQRNNQTVNGGNEKVETANNNEKAQQSKEELNKQASEPKAFTSSANTEKFFSNQKLAAYSLYSACFEYELYFEDYKIYSKWLKITRQDWRKIVKQLNNQMSQKIDYIPFQKTWHYTLRVCRKRRIQFPEEKAMKTMCENIAKAVIPHGAKRSTTAACVFWQVCVHSKRYKDLLTLNQICKKSKQKVEEIDEKDEQKYFDCTPETIRSYFKNYIEKELYTKFLPEFDGIFLTPEAIKIFKMKREEANKKIQ